jgi:hypothetical protein
LSDQNYLDADTAAHAADPALAHAGNLLQPDSRLTLVQPPIFDHHLLNMLHQIK